MAAQRRAQAIDYRACPAGAKRGVDVARMYSEIAKLVRAKYAGAEIGADLDDLVQEVVLTIARRNAMDSAFDPARAGFGKYVNVVASNVLGHMRGSQIRRDRPVTLPGDEALAALDVGSELAAAAPVGEPDARTVGELVERLEDVVDQAREAAREIRRRRGPETEACYQDGVLAATRAVVELLGVAFDEEAVVAAPRRPARSTPAADVVEQLTAPVAELLYTWDRIGARLGVSAPTARGYALRERDPLPVEADHRGVCVELAALEAWRARQRAPYVAPRAA